MQDLGLCGRTLEVDTWPNLRGDTCQFLTRNISLLKAQTP
jgi:hypothetical protein